MSECKIFVGNLSYDATEEDVRDAFKKFDPSEVIIITDRETGRPRGFGFVTFSKESDMEAAKTEMNGHQLLGRDLTVNSAAAKKQRSEGGQQRRGGYPSRDNYGGGGGRQYNDNYNGGGGYGGGQGGGHGGGYGGGYQQGGRGGQGGGYGGGNYGGGKIDYFYYLDRITVSFFF